MNDKDLCISILEFKFSFETSLLVSSIYLCISILEFKFEKLLAISSVGWNLCISILEFKFVYAYNRKYLLRFMYFYIRI